MTPNLLPTRLREFVDAELESYHRCDVAGELQQLSDELVPGWQGFKIKGGDASGRTRPGRGLESGSTHVTGPRAGNGPRPANRKLTAEIARQIRASSETGKELAARFGVSQATISHIRRGHTWRDA